jgi:hypothetical protein
MYYVLLLFSFTLVSCSSFLGDPTYRTNKSSLKCKLPGYPIHSEEK